MYPVMLAAKTHVPSLYPKVLHEASRHLRHRLQDRALCRENTDGRINSIKDEETVLTCLREQFEVKRPKDRHWYDASIHDPESNHWIPINIKVTEGGCDNALNKKAIVYSYSTLVEEDIPSNMHFNKMVELVQNNLKPARDPCKEYYYMCIDKHDKSVLVRSLCDVQELRSNPQNWLQIHWKKEWAIHVDELPPRTVSESFHRVKNIIRESMYKIVATSYKLFDIDCKNEHVEEDVLALVERIKLEES